MSSHPEERAAAPGARAAHAADRNPEHRLATLLGARLYRLAGLAFLLGLLLLYFEPISRVLLIGFVGAILGIALNAIVVRIPLRRGFSVAIVALATLATISLAVWLAITFLVGQIRGLVEEMPSLLAGVEAWEEWLQETTGLEIELLGPRVQRVLGELFGGLEGGALLASAFGLFELLGLTALVLVGAFFVVAKPNEQLLIPLMRAVPPERRPAFRRMFALLGERLAGWLWGTALSVLIIGGLAVVTFWLLGVPYWLLLGVLVGVTDIIPLVGPWIGGLLAVGVTLFHDPGLALWVGVAVLVIQQVESNLVRPVVMSGSAKLHPFVTLLALLLFGSIFGLLGAILALPITLAIATIVQVLWVEEALGVGDEEIEEVVDE